MLSLAHDVLHDEYLGHDNDDDIKMSHIVLAVQLLDFHMKIYTYTTEKFMYCAA